MKIYEQPLIELVCLSSLDVLSASGGQDLGDGDIGFTTGDFDVLGGGE